MEEIRFSRATDSLVTHRLLAEGLGVFLAHLPAHGQRDRLHLLAQARRLVGVRTLGFLRGLLKRQRVTPQCAITHNNTVT